MTITHPERLPRIIQGGMGIGVSTWPLARAVAERGQLGVISGTAIDTVVAYRLQLGDPDGNVRRALDAFPWPAMARRFWDQHYIAGGKGEQQQFRPVPMHTQKMTRAEIEQIIVANFVEVWLAKEGHSGVVGVNYLEKIQVPILPALFGVMLGGVDFVLMGGGIPAAIPGYLDALSRWEPQELKLHVEDNPNHQVYSYHFDPAEYCEDGIRPALRRPSFLAIVSSDIIAKNLARKATGYVDGFIVENYIAGGHNAPPRSKPDPANPDAPVGFCEKDDPDLDKIREIGRPFWLAGGFALPEKLQEALAAGATGIQVGTAFAYCDESAIVPEIKREVLRRCKAGTLKIDTDFQASPTGYPFKVIHLDTTTTGDSGPNARKRVCDLGYLRHAYPKSETELGYRCPSEPIQAYIRKGGAESRTVGKQCLCNGLLATVGLGQVRGEKTEPALVTSGEDFSFVARLLENGRETYAAREAIAFILGEEANAAAPCPAQSAARE
jgi:nitronate monooxygenase